MNAGVNSSFKRNKPVRPKAVSLAPTLSVTISSTITATSTLITAYAGISFLTAADSLCRMAWNPLLPSLVIQFICSARR